jgi:signal transduction histidine kinase
MASRTPLVPLPVMRFVHGRRFLAPPWVPPIVARPLGRACRARPLAAPIHLVLPTPHLAVRFGRALHAVTGPAGDLLAATDERPELRALPNGATLVVDPTRLDPEGVLQLAAIVDDGEVWVIAVSDGTTPVPDVLAERLAGIVVEVPPLARRQLELPALSAAILQLLAERAGRERPTLTPAARTRLATQAWPGDVLELEAVLARALASTEGATIDVTQLGFEPEPVDEAEVVPEPVVPSDGRLENLLAELSHEILNPLSTVKMLVGHLPQLLEDAEARDQLAGRADDAITRVDLLLQNVLEFARMGEPRREPVEVGPLLDRLLREAAPELAERAVRVRRTGGAELRCVGDPVQLEYGLRNLLAGVVREVPARDEFVIDTERNGVVAVRFGTGDVAVSRLRSLLAPEGERELGDPRLLPLPFTLARAVLERNGGSLAVQEETEGPTTLVVRLPTGAVG